MGCAAQKQNRTKQQHIMKIAQIDQDCSDKEINNSVYSTDIENIQEEAHENANGMIFSKIN
jgi:hypothetical protein